MMQEEYEKEQTLNSLGEAVIAAAVMGLVCLGLYFAELPAVWHLTVVISASVVLLALIIAHGIQGIANQVHLSSTYLARVVAERAPK